VLLTGFLLSEWTILSFGAQLDVYAIRDIVLRGYYPEPTIKCEKDKDCPEWRDGFGLCVGGESIGFKQDICWFKSYKSKPL